MNSEITEQYLTTSYENFLRETQRLMNDLKTSTDEVKNKHTHKEINVLHSIELNILKLKSLKKSYNDKIKNL